MVEFSRVFTYTRKIDKEDIDLRPFPIGLNGLFLADYGHGGSNKELVIDDMELYWSLDYHYHTNAKKFDPIKYQFNHFLVYTSRSGGLIAFEQGEDLYDFIFKSLDTNSYIDITSKKFTNISPTSKK